MNRVAGPEEIERLRALIVARTGLQFDESKRDFLADVLNRRLEATGAPDVRSYLASLSGDEWRALPDALTVSETYFFRYADHFRAFLDVVLPDRMRARAATRKLRFLSAGCASGEEPYSIAMLARERISAEMGRWDLRIQAIDISPAALKKAARARYSTWSLRETPDAYRTSCFREEGREFTLDASIRDVVAFEERNLTADDPFFWREESFDAVFCRNVTMYFAPEVTSAVIARIARSLVPGGYFFLGHAETLRGISQEFHLRHTHETFYYQRREAGEERIPSIDIATLPRAPVPLPVLPMEAPWIDAIRNASERIAALAPKSHEPVHAQAEPRRAWDLSHIIELLRQERFTEAMGILDALPAESLGDPDTQLLRAVILTNAGKGVEAEEAADALLRIDELNAGAHYLVALCREYARDVEGAINHDQTAIYLDAGFAMPHLHWGLMAKRLGDGATAQRELRQASQLLPREDASRILLFGGGFHREALIEMCRAELRASGGIA